MPKAVHICFHSSKAAKVSRKILSTFTDEFFHNKSFLTRGMKYLTEFLLYGGEWGVGTSKFIVEKHFNFLTLLTN